ncbi:MAG TPA: MerR family transcriptional regulator [Bacteroidia bacterium]|nr:MerR family transcriptional regulator [Bacteroidia bacterium]
MLIGELVRKTGLSKDTIRFYEKKGLIQVGKNDRRENNYKEYSEKAFFRLATIKKITGYGFTLSETAEFLEMIESNQASCNNVSDKITQKIDLINKRIAGLVAVKELLTEEVHKCEEACLPEDGNCPILIPVSV